MAPHLRPRAKRLITAMLASPGLAILVPAPGVSTSRSDGSYCTGAIPNPAAVRICMLYPFGPKADQNGFVSPFQLADSRD
jgi:hypothetical protein